MTGCCIDEICWGQSHAVKDALKEEEEEQIPTTEGVSSWKLKQGFHSKIDDTRHYLLTVKGGGSIWNFYPVHDPQKQSVSSLSQEENDEEITKAGETVEMSSFCPEDGIETDVSSDDDGSATADNTPVKNKTKTKTESSDDLVYSESLKESELVYQESLKSSEFWYSESLKSAENNTNNSNQIYMHKDAIIMEDEDDHPEICEDDEMEETMKREESKEKISKKGQVTFASNKEEVEKEPFTMTDFLAILDGSQKNEHPPDIEVPNANVSTEQNTPKREKRLKSLQDYWLCLCGTSGEEDVALSIQKEEEDKAAYGPLLDQEHKQHSLLDPILEEEDEGQESQEYALYCSVSLSMNLVYQTKEGIDQPALQVDERKAIEANAAATAIDVIKEMAFESPRSLEEISDDDLNIFVDESEFVDKMSDDEVNIFAEESEAIDTATTSKAVPDDDNNGGNDEKEVKETTSNSKAAPDTDKNRYIYQSFGESTTVHVYTESETDREETTFLPTDDENSELEESSTSSECSVGEEDAANTDALANHSSTETLVENCAPLAEAAEQIPLEANKDAPNARPGEGDRLSSTDSSFSGQYDEISEAPVYAWVAVAMKIRFISEEEINGWTMLKDEAWTRASSGSVQKSDGGDHDGDGDENNNEDGSLKKGYDDEDSKFLLKCRQQMVADSSSPVPFDEESSLVFLNEHGNDALEHGIAPPTEDDRNKLLIQEALNRTAAKSKAAAAEALNDGIAITQSHDSDDEPVHVDTGTVHLAYAPYREERTSPASNEASFHNRNEEGGLSPTTYFGVNYADEVPKTAERSGDNEEEGESISSKETISDFDLPVPVDLVSKPSLFPRTHPRSVSPKRNRKGPTAESSLSKKTHHRCLSEPAHHYPYHELRNQPPPLRMEAWSEPTGEDFMVRGEDYLSKGVKQLSESSAFRLLTVDVVRSSSSPIYEGLCLHPTERVQQALKREEQQQKGSELPPFVFAVNLVIPGESIYHLVSYFAIDNMDEVENASTPFGKLINQFIFGDSDEFRDNTFKLIPKIVFGNLIVRKAVGSKPTLLGTKLKQYYVKGPRYFELVVDIASDQIAKRVVKLAMGYAKTLVVDMAFVLEGKTESTLPERVFGGVRLKNLDFKEKDGLRVVEPTNTALRRKKNRA